jgi:multiple sugar transport system substrate-binding protein
MDGTMRRARGVSRRGFLKMGGLAGAAVLGGGLVAGCGGGEESSGGAVEIVLGFIPDEAGGLQTLLDRFNKQNKGEIQVKWRQMPASSAEYFEQMQAELQSGRSTMDIIAGDVVWPAQFAANNYILDLSDRFTQKMQADYLEGPVQAVQFQGKTYGVPWFTDAGMFYYRKDLLENAGFSEPPRTWDEMKDMSERIRADSGTKFGYVFQGAQDEGGVVDALEHIWPRA